MEPLDISSEDWDALVKMRAGPALAAALAESVATALAAKFPPPRQASAWRGSAS